MKGAAEETANACDVGDGDARFSRRTDGVTPDDSGAVRHGAPDLRRESRKSFSANILQTKRQHLIVPTARRPAPRRKPLWTAPEIPSTLRPAISLSYFEREF